MLDQLSTDTCTRKGVGVRVPSSAPFDPEPYLSELSLLRKPATEIAARQIIYEFLPFASQPDSRKAVLAYLTSRREAGNDNRTLEKKRIRIVSWLKHSGVDIDIPSIRFVIRRPEMYRPEELTALFNAANGRDFWLYQTLWKAGLRMQEAMFLEYGNLLDTGIQVAPHGDWTPKDHEERTVKVPRRLIDSLRGLPRIGGSNLVFPSLWGGPNWHMLRSLKRAAKRGGLDPANCFLHKFRANFCTALLRGGVDIRTVMGQMGHADLKSTMRYLCLLEDQTLADKIEAIWG